MVNTKSCPGVPLEILQPEYWVLGLTLRGDSAKFAGKPLFKEILATNGGTCTLWVRRLIKDILLSCVLSTH